MEIKKIDNVFTTGELEGICKVIADTFSGLTGSEIGYILSSMKIKDMYPTMTKWKRLYNAILETQNKTQNGKVVLTFISKALEPARYIDRREEYVEMISGINKVLSFRGAEFKEDGKFHIVKAAKTLKEAEERAKVLHGRLIDRNVHEHLLNYCKVELLEDNYFHAVLEACKSIAAKIREITGLKSDGAKLIDESLGGKEPLIRLNSLDTETKISEQKGFVNIAKGLFGTFRNPTAHDPKIEWKMTEEDALDIFSMASYILRRLENRN